MSQLVPHFTFTLGRHESIGPTELGALWRQASGSARIRVGRHVVRGDHERPVYTLYGVAGLPDLAGAERRLREMFAAASINASLMPVGG